MFSYVHCIMDKSLVDRLLTQICKAQFLSMIIIDIQTKSNYICIIIYLLTIIFILIMIKACNFACIINIMIAFAF